MSQKIQQETCQDLHPVMNFAIRSYAACPGAKLFLEWFLGVFSKESPQLARGFAFRGAEFEGRQMLEVQAHDPLFTIDALESLWLQYKLNDAKPVATPEDDKKVIPIKMPTGQSSSNH